jgi:hypothetical protein
MRLRLVLAGSAVVLLATSCGGRTKAAAPPPTVPATTVEPTTTTVSIAALAQQYLAIVAPANTALDTFDRKLAALGSSPTGAQIATVATPLITAINVADQQLLRVAWPPNIKTDINSLVTAESALAADLGTAASQNALTASTWESALTADAGKLNAAVSIVRADLGLPPPSG